MKQPLLHFHNPRGFKKDSTRQLPPFPGKYATVGFRFSHGRPRISLHSCAARSNSAISSFFIFIMACMALEFRIRARQLRGHDLPAQAEFIFEPAALDFAAACSEFRPVIVHLLLRVATDHE